MIRHGVGVNRRPLELLAVDEEFFAGAEETAYHGRHREQPVIPA